MAVLALQNVPGCRYIRFFKWLANIKDKPLYVLYFHSTGIKYETNIALKFILVENQTTSFSTRQAPNKKKYFPKTSVWLSFCHYGGYRTRKGHYWHYILSKVHNMYYTSIQKKGWLLKISVCVLFPCLLSRLVNICSESFCFISFMTLLNNLIQHQILMCMPENRFDSLMLQYIKHFIFVFSIL